MGVLGGCRYGANASNDILLVLKVGVNVWGALWFVWGLWGVSGNGDEGGLWVLSN